MRNSRTFLGASVCLCVIISARVLDLSPKLKANEGPVRAAS